MMATCLPIEGGAKKRAFLSRRVSGNTWTRHTPEEFADAFWLRVQRGAVDECWPFIGGSETKTGYKTLIDLSGKRRTAHSVAWTIENNRSVPYGMEVCHICDNPPCCNPAHLFAGTRKENMQDSVAKGRHWQKTLRAKSSKLNPELVRQIRFKRSIGVPVLEIAKEHGVCFQAIYLLLAKKTWGRVE